VTILRPFLVGLLSAVMLVLVVLHAEGYRNPQLYWLSPLPLLALYAAAVFEPVAGWLSRLARGALGFLAAAAVGYVAFLVLRGSTDWFAGLDGSWVILIVLLHAAVPGGAAAAADSPRRGLALAGGFTFAMCVAIGLARYSKPGFATVLIVGTVVGWLVNALGRARSR
jgi:hypothetical protein